jgi:hypothetical protein
MWVALQCTALGMFGFGKIFVGGPTTTIAGGESLLLKAYSIVSSRSSNGRYLQSTYDKLFSDG